MWTVPRATDLVLTVELGPSTRLVDQSTTAHVCHWVMALDVRFRPVTKKKGKRRDTSFDLVYVFDSSDDQSVRSVLCLVAEVEHAVAR